MRQLWAGRGTSACKQGLIALLVVAHCWSADGILEQEPCKVAFVNEGSIGAKLFWLSPDAGGPEPITDGRKFWV
eukprot:s2707_g7.t1